MKRYIYPLLLLMFPALLFSTTDPVLCLDKQFHVRIHKDVLYGNALVYYPVKGLKSLHLDMYLPANPDEKSAMPCMVVVHGNTPENEGKTAAEIKLFGLDMASRGYVIIAVEYRSSNELGPGQKPLTAAIEDIRTSLAWVKDNSAQYRIDPNRIFIAGFSEGATMMLEAVYHGNGMKNIMGAVDLWGKFYYRDPVRKGSPPLLIVHGLNDGFIPVQEAQIVSALLEKAGVKQELELIDTEGHAIPLNGRYGGKDLMRIIAEFCHDKIRLK